MKRHFFTLSLLFILAVLSGCQKEYSFENGSTPSDGSLQSDTGGDCLPKTVAGTYEAGTAVTAANYIEVEVNVTTPGSYLVYTDTLNGVYFRASGVFSAAGTNTIQLKAFGTPVASGINNYVVTYGASACIIAVTTLPSGAGGPASITLTATAGACMGFTLNGTYTTGVALSAATNTVDINITVNTIGTYNITTPTNNGIFFSGSGALLTTGPQTITLTGHGQPLASGTTNITVTAGASTCSFPVVVVGPASYTVNCATAAPAGTYTQNVALDPATNTVTLDINVVTVGGYTVSATGGGMTFTKSGTFTATGPQQVVLVGGGSPSASGTVSVTVTGGTGTCNFNVTVAPGAAIDWKFTQGTLFQGGVTASSLDVTVLPPPIGTTLTTLLYSGESTAGELFNFVLADMSGGIQVNETYPSNATTTNFVTFDFEGVSPLTYTADFTTSGVVLTFKVTAHNTTTKTISGTFSGTVRDNTNAIKTISGGTFTCVYP